MKPTIEAVVFDAYGTLFDVHSVTALAEQMFPGRGAELSLLWREKQLSYSWLRTLSDRYIPFIEVTRDGLRWAARRLGLPMDETAEARLLGQYACLSAFPENLDALRRMRAIGLPMGILSNGSPEMLQVSVRSAGMDGLFDHLLSADSVRCYKTRAEVYELGPKAFGVPAERILFVSSNGWDVAGATWFGYPCFWINRGALPLEELGVEPGASGSLLTEVVDYILTSRSSR